LRLLIGAFFVALSMTLTGCGGAEDQGKKEDKQEQQKKDEKKDEVK